MTEEANPYPARAGDSTYWGSRMNDEYIPNPSRNPTRFVVQTPRMRIIRMSTSGCEERVSLRTHDASSTRPSAKQPSVLDESQCQFTAWLIATSTATRPADISAAPVQLTRPGVRTGDSGTNTRVATVAATTGINGSQNRKWNERWSTIGPASTTPSPPPTPSNADIKPIAEATRSRGNSSRMMPMASGKMPPAAP